MVGKYGYNDNTYNFGGTKTIYQHRELIQKALWPVRSTLGSPIERFIVHFHSGVGGCDFRRSPNLEPTYFFKASDIAPANAIIRHSIKSTDDEVCHDVTVRGKVWIE